MPAPRQRHLGDTIADPMVGRVLDRRYRVVAKIARGGMATVYEAVDLRLDRQVAVKVMHAGLVDDETFVARFEREARHAAKLAHPNVVGVYDQGDDIGVDGDTLFLVMEYVPGLTLRDLIRKEAPLRPAKALALLEPVLEALGAAHAAGMIHRDVKPENVLLADDGSIKVADFGLARAVNAETQHTATGGVLIGTVSYLAPELVVRGRADARADVYAAGIVLYELLTGTKPHQGDSPINVAYKHVHEDVPPPSSAVPGLPAYVDALVARATARDASLRPADARVLLHHVHRVRSALEHGVDQDDVLTEDLDPTAPIRLPAELGDAAEPPEAVDETPVEPTPTKTSPPPPGRPAYDEAARVANPRRRGRKLRLLLVALLVAALGAAGWWFGLGRYTSAPSVLELDRAAARARIQHAGLHFRLGTPAYSETVRKGLVLASDPDPRGRVLKHGTVTVTLSLGPERHAVPAVVGKPLDTAQAMLQDAKLSYGSAHEQWSDTVAKGAVISSDPAVGTSLRPDSAVDVVVSKGPQPVQIPNFTGDDAARATRRLHELKLTVVTTRREYSDTVDAGDIISQSPSSGTGHHGDKVSLVVSRGPELLPVPLVRGKRVASARRILEDAGFRVAVQRSDVYISFGLVVRQSAAAGNKVPKGSVITLTVV